MIKLKRVYDPAAAGDGKRFLVERLWPRAMKKTDLKMDAWLKDVAPSTTLRQWFNHDPGKWKEFQRRYSLELKSHADAIEPLLEAARAGTDIAVLESFGRRIVLSKAAGLEFRHNAWRMSWWNGVIGSHSWRSRC